jgi:hypothetical protein
MSKACKNVVAFQTTPETLLFSWVCNFIELLTHMQLRNKSLHETQQTIAA